MRKENEERKVTIMEKLLSQENLELISKAASVSEDDDIEVEFGKPCECKGHLGESLYRLWVWECPEYVVVTFDEGNGQCHVVQVFRKEWLSSGAKEV